MKDSFIFEGKKYISAKRASEISDYSSDYIGQLCRGGKLDCRMIGRSWFVAEASLHAHKATVLTNEVHRNRIQNLRGGKKAVQTVATPSQSVTSTAPLATPVAASEPAPFTRFQKPQPVFISAQIPAVQTAVSVPSTEVVQAPIVAPEVLPALTYERDDRPLLPVVTKAEVHAAPKPEPVVVSEPAQHAEEYDSIVRSVPLTKTPSLDLRQTTTVQTPYEKFGHSIGLRRLMYGTVALLAVIGISMGALVMSNGSRTRGLTRNSSANIFDAVTAIETFITDNISNVVALFSHRSDLSMNTAPAAQQVQSAGGEGTQAPSGSTGSGIAVVPSTGSSASDAALKQQIQSTFSDQVEVKPDQSGTAGVITPVFKSTKGKDFVYVMVPLDSGANTGTNAAGKNTSGNSP